MGELVRPHGEDATLDTVIERPPTPLSHLLTATKLRRIELSLGRGIMDMGELATLTAIFPVLKEMVLDIGGPKEKEIAPQLARIAELTPFKSHTRLDLRGSSAVQAALISGLERLPMLDYLDIPFPFKDDDVAKLKKIFPEGVCDYSRPDRAKPAG